jgi:nitrogen regulatory protein PII
MHDVVVSSGPETAGHVVHEDMHELDRDGHGVGAIFVADVDRFLNFRRGSCNAWPEPS